MVSAELAVGMASLIAVLVVAMSALSLGMTQVALVDAARLGARSAARGDSTATVVATAQQAAPGAQVTLGTAGALVEVTVRARAPAVLSAIGVADPSATARTRIESAIEPDP